MRADDIADELHAVLEAERVAIATLDAFGVEALADDKQRLLRALEALPPTDRASLVETLGPLVGELRHNCVLLAHARDCLRDAVMACGGSQTTSDPRMGVTVRTGTCVRVKG